MTPLLVLLVVFAVLYLLSRKFTTALSLSRVGRYSMAVMLLVTAIAHFTNTAEMVEMMPDALPLKRELVYFTGLCEVAAAIGLMWDKTAKLASIMLIIFFIAVLPANIAGSLKSVQFGGMDYGPAYLFFRIPLQLFFIVWVWYFGIRRARDNR